MAQQAVQAPQATGRGRRGPGFYVGLVLLLAGLSMLGYVAWQYVGTNIVAHRAQRALVQQTERQWRANGGAAATGSGVVLHGADALIRIPRFGAGYVMPVQSGVSDAVLAEGFGHFDGTAGPGRRGNYALAAHRVTHGEPLRNMPELRPGDTVIVETGHRVYTYVLDTDPNALVVSFHDVWVLDPLPTNPRGGVQPAQRPGQKLITLTTCSELFHTDNRMVAFGHLVGTAPR